MAASRTAAALPTSSATASSIAQSRFIASSTTSPSLVCPSIGSSLRRSIVGVAQPPLSAATARFGREGTRLSIGIPPIRTPTRDYLLSRGSTLSPPYRLPATQVSLIRDSSKSMLIYYPDPRRPPRVPACLNFLSAAHPCFIPRRRFPPDGWRDDWRHLPYICTYARQPCRAHTLCEGLGVKPKPLGHNAVCYSEKLIDPPL